MGSPRAALKACASSLSVPLGAPPDPGVLAQGMCGCMRREIGGEMQNGYVPKIKRKGVPKGQRLEIAFLNAQ